MSASATHANKACVSESRRARSGNVCVYYTKGQLCTPGASLSGTIRVSVCDTCTQDLCPNITAPDDPDVCVCDAREHLCVHQNPAFLDDPH
eukprot:10879339-Alexandrium_andersonii.AAC.1